MLGERVAVLRRAQAGTDAMGEPVWEWSPEFVDGCLVRPLSGSDLGQQLSPDGVLAEYSVAFPKAYAGELRHARVALMDRGMDADDAGAAYAVIGSPDVTRPCPTKWNRIASIGRAHG